MPVVLAKHGRPPPIEPIVRDGIRYVVPNDKGRHAYVQAWDTSTDRKIWTVTVFRRIYVPRPFRGKSSGSALKLKVSTTATLRIHRLQAWVGRVAPSRANGSILPV